MGGIGTDSARCICVGFVVLLMNCSSACSHRRWHKTLLGIIIDAKERIVCSLSFPHLLVEDYNHNLFISGLLSQQSVSEFRNQVT